MKFHKVDNIPETKYGKERNDIASALKEFMAMGIKRAEVTYTELEFPCCCTASSSLTEASRRLGVPVKVYVRNNTVYLERQDI